MSERADISRLQSIKKLPVYIEILEEAMEMTERFQRGALTKQQRTIFECIQERHREERRCYIEERQKLEKYIQGIEREELKQIFRQLYIDGLEYSLVYYRLYGFKSPDAGSYLRHRIYRYLDRHPLPPEPWTEKERKEDKQNEL